MMLISKLLEALQDMHLNYFKIVTASLKAAKETTNSKALQVFVSAGIRSETNFRELIKNLEELISAIGAIKSINDDALTEESLDAIRQYNDTMEEIMKKMHENLDKIVDE